MQRYSYLPTAALRRENHAFRIKEQAHHRTLKCSGKLPYLGIKRSFVEFKTSDDLEATTSRASSKSVCR
jgi:hypothetical protein